ncbi:MAG TPA: DEAD/DEAH box helicase [Rectinemataceae bacterium]|nr:DEAD/DEAH box helicase [Rectinemataceae bacterium]
MNDMTFSSLGLVEPVLAAIRAVGYDTPTPIQVASIPPLLAGRDLLASAQTGTGKTAAFALPIIQRLAASPRHPAPRSCRVLVVAPTRELAAQIDASFAAYGKGSPLSRACVFGGVGKSPQIKALGRGVDVLTATPGRLLDLHGEGQVRLDAVETVVLDEADRMLDMGFIRDVRKIMSLLPARRQTLLFSATMPSDIASLASSVLRDPIRISVSPDRPAVELIEQRVAFVEKTDKRAYLGALIEAQSASRAIVFTRTKHGADRLAKSLSSGGIAAAAIHANKSQNTRTKTLDRFRTGELRVLVATDLAARGIDVDSISHVYNYELPDVPETYVHRIGRTARAGADGEAVALCDSEERPLLRAIERLLHGPLTVGSGPAFDFARAKAAEERLRTPAASSSSPAGMEQRRSAEPGPRGRGPSSRGSASGRGDTSRGRGNARRTPGAPDRAPARTDRRRDEPAARREGGKRGSSLRDREALSARPAGGATPRGQIRV